MAQPQMTDNQKHCANVARLLSETFPESDPDVLTPPPPRGTEEPPSSFVEAQQQRGAVRRSFERVEPDEAVGLAQQHAPEGLEDLYKAAGGEDEYRKALEEPPTVRGVASARLTLQGYVGAGGGRGLKVTNACEVRGEDGSWRGGVVEAVTHTDGEFDWDTSAFTVDLLDGDQVQGVRGGDIRAPQKLVERTLPTGLEGFGERDFDARSPVGRSIALTTVAPETRADATLSADAGRRRSRAENLRNFGQDEDRDASIDDVGLGAVAPSHVLDDATAPTERAPPTEADGDAMKIDAPPAAARARALPDAAAPPLLGHGPATEPAPPTTIRSGEGGPDAAMEDAPEARAPPDAAPLPAPVVAPETTAASEPVPPTTTESVGGDGDASMPDAPPSMEAIACKYQDIATGKLLRKKRKKKDQDIFDEAAPRQAESAASLVARVFNATSTAQACYKQLTSVFVDIGSTLAEMKEAISDALKDVSAADFLTTARAPEPVAAEPAPAPPRSTTEQAWEPDARKMLDEVKDLPAGELGPILTRYGFTVTSKSKKFSHKNPASPPGPWPCVHDIVGKNFGGKDCFKDEIRSKSQLVAYLEEALKQAREGTSFRLESEKKAEDAQAAALEPSTVAGALGRAKQIENFELDVAHWHAFAGDEWRHRLYRNMRDKGMVIEDEPCMLVGPSKNKPPIGAAGFYDGPLSPDVTKRQRMTEEKCTTTEQLEAWRKAERVDEILNGVYDSHGNVVVPGVYHEEYKAWKAMRDTVVGSREERQDYSERGLYGKAIRNAIDTLRRDDPRRFYSLALGALKYKLGRSVPHLEALAERHGIDVADLTALDVNGRVYFTSPWAKCKIPGALHGLMRPLHVEHVNIGWDGETATYLLGFRDLADGKFNIAEPHVALVTERPELRTFVDEYLDNGTLCFSKDDAERELFQMLMDPISTAARREFLALPYQDRSKEELNFLRKVVMAGVVKPKTNEDRRRRDILHARHERLDFEPNASDRAGRGTWTAVSRVKGRNKEIGKWYDATVLRQYGSGSSASFDVEFADDGYVAKGVAAGDVRRGSDRDKKLPPNVGATGKACYRGTKLDLDHVGLGWRWERVVPSEEYPDGLKWYRILGIRDLLDYDINRNLSGYEWAKNLDLLDYFANYYKNALCEVGGGGIKASDWVFKWTPAKEWAYGGFS